MRQIVAKEDLIPQATIMSNKEKLKKGLEARLFYHESQAEKYRQALKDYERPQLGLFEKKAN